MTIEKISLNNITVFEKMDIAFSHGINILIGENGTGKTHIMKILYAISQDSQGLLDIFENSYKRIITDGKLLEVDRRIENPTEKETELTSALAQGSFIIEYFSSNKPEFSNLVRNKERTNSKNKFRDTEEMSLVDNEITLESDNEIFEIGVVSDDLISIAHKQKVKNKQKNNFIFIPAKDIISHSKGFVSTYNFREIAFDKTYYDIILNAQKGNLKKPEPEMAECLKILENIIGGKVELDGDQFVVKKKGGLTIEFNYEAEGLKKLGLLYRLISNGSISKGAVLFWDEPESNINPIMAPIVVDVLLKLRKAGVQIFIATHDYNFAKYFDIKSADDDKLKFYSFFKGNNNAVNYVESEDYSSLENNPLEEADTKLYDDVVDKALEDNKNE
ncbi:ATP-binding protein [Clostridium estertheticum]|uniref:ATP-binding protein n=1 Tax=Clostridium estertheticum TaxID=238834 RepID=UPI001C6EDBD7|nr:ATP-binding protein [Clostridium estertheticum]MBW9152179.1 AAA family ATPase [Clostridium estertheticum]WLC85200.1 AAA family ATPase [Clostridium estertheticum]